MKNYNPLNTCYRRYLSLQLKTRAITQNELKYILTVLQHSFHLFYAVIKKCQASILVTHKTALFNKAAEYLCFGEMCVEFCIGTVSAF